MRYLASFAKEVDIELVVNRFIPLVAECGTQGLLNLFVGTDGALERLVYEVIATMCHGYGFVFGKLMGQYLLESCVVFCVNGQEVMWDVDGVSK